MSVTILSRGRGVCMRCNYDACAATLMTAQVQAKLVRVYAGSQGWIRGLDPGSGSPDTGGRPANRRWDICPEHAVAERQRAAERKLASDERKRLRSLPKVPMTIEQVTARKLEINAARRAKRAALRAPIPQVAA